MSEMDELRSLVLARKGQWTLIARVTGLSTKTLSRIANGEATDVRLSTAKVIREAIQKIQSGGMKEQTAEQAVA